MKVKQSFFFLHSTKVGIYQDLELENVFQIYSGVQGIYNYKSNVSRTLYSELDEYRDIELFYHDIGITKYADYINKRVSQTHNNETSNIANCVISNLREVALSYSNTSSDNRIVYAELDLFIKSSSGSFRLFDANLETYYNINIFGSNIVSNSRITAFKGSLFTNNYNLILSDEESDKIKIRLLGTTTTASSLQNIDTVYKHVARFTVEILGWDGKSPIEWDELTNDFDKYSEEGTNVIRNFECEKLELGINCGMEINTITEIAAAGTGIATELNTPGVIEIHGEGFLNENAEFGNCEKPLKHHVKFNTIHNGWIAPLEGDYLEYTDNLIRVKVPTVGYIDDSNTLYTDINDGIAATGKIIVCREGGLFGSPCGCNEKSDVELFVPHAFRNQSRVNFNGCLESKKSLLRNENSLGGYTMRFHPNFKDYSGAVGAFKRALMTWRCETLVNMNVDEVGTGLSGPGICVIKMEALDVGIKASTSDGYTICGSDFDYIMRKEGFLIKLYSNYTWHTGTNMPGLNWENQFDMESTVLHELGHGFTMLHTKNDNSIMLRPSLPQYKRSFAPEDRVGGIQVSLLSSQQLTNKCNDVAMALIDPSECMLASDSEVIFQPISLYPNPTSEFIKLNIEFQPKKIEIIDLYGKVIKSHKTENMNKDTISIIDLSSGLYFLRVFPHNGKSLLIKFVKI